MRLFSIVGIIAIGQTMDPLAYYFVYAPIILYAFIYTWKNDFSFKIGERIIFLLGEAIFVTLFSIFLFNPQYIQDYDLDLFGLALVLLIDVIFVIVKLVRLIKYGK
jgi:hypothetical protein